MRSRDAVCASPRTGSHRRWFTVLMVCVIAWPLSPQAVCGLTAEEAAMAVEEAGKAAIPGSEFLTILENADLIAIATLKGFLRKRKQDVQREYLDKTRSLSDATKRVAAIDAMMGKVQSAQQARERRHQKEGEDPWTALFNITTPGFEPPTVPGQVVAGTAEIDTTSERVAAWVAPAVWHIESPTQEPEGSITFTAKLLDSGEFEVQLTSFALNLPTFPVNVPTHTESGENVWDYGPTGPFLLRPNEQGMLSFSLFGVMTNDLYSAVDPALDFVNGTVLLIPGDELQPWRLWIEADDKLLVPWPKEPDERPIMYAASQSVFDPASRSIRFHDPFQLVPSGIPIVALDAFDGTFWSMFNAHNGAPIGASLTFGDLTIVEQDASRVVFADVSFAVCRGQETLVTGLLIHPRLNLGNGDFLASTAQVQLFTSNPILGQFFTSPHRYQFMSPIEALYFHRLTDGFSQALPGPVAHPHITLVNHNCVPPSSPADYDGDGDVDIADFETFIDCLSGPAVGPISVGCQLKDFDADADVDQVDFGTFQRCYTGVGIAGSPACAQ